MGYDFPAPKKRFFEISTHQGVLYGTAYFFGGVFTSHDGGENWTRAWNDTRRFAINRYNNHFYRIDLKNLNGQPFNLLIFN